jgi:hypothetical protein
VPPWLTPQAGAGPAPPAFPPSVSPPWAAPPETDWMARLRLLLDYLRQSGGTQDAGLGGSR